MQAGTDTAEFRMAQGVGTLMLGTAGTDRLAITKTGSVGIGTTTPVSKLNVKVGDAGGNPSQSQENIVLESNDNAYISIVTPKAYQSGISFSNDTANARGGIYYGQQSYINADAMRFHTAGAERIRIDNSGNVGIGTTSPDSKLHVAGNGHVTGNLQVDGNIAAKYQDVAEWVKTSEQLTAGTVVMIDPEKANQVIASDKPYNTLVAGVVSEQPGIILGEASEDKAIIAHTGRVRVKVDASNGKISAGDLLVTSSVKGYAMRSEPIDIGGAKIHRPGTIVGKALEPLADGQRGEILVLITLQ
ncbi:MAG: hypothetical protein HY758_03960 [Nitrospirae bacterium]|nr:hypothetical protein [Nitrospirota bacterium]